MVISKHDSFRVLFDKIASVYFILKKIYLYFSIGNGGPREPALCQLYRHNFVPYSPPAVESTTWARQQNMMCGTTAYTQSDWQMKRFVNGGFQVCVGVAKRGSAYGSAGLKATPRSREGQVVPPRSTLTLCCWPFISHVRNHPPLKNTIPSGLYRGH